MRPDLHQEPLPIGAWRLPIVDRLLFGPATQAIQTMFSIGTQHETMRPNKTSWDHQMNLKSEIPGPRSFSEGGSNSKCASTLHATRSPPGATANRRLAIAYRRSAIVRPCATGDPNHVFHWNSLCLCSSVVHPQTMGTTDQPGAPRRSPSPLHPKTHKTKSECI